MKSHLHVIVFPPTCFLGYKLRSASQSKLWTCARHYYKLRRILPLYTSSALYTDHFVTYWNEIIMRRVKRLTDFTSKYGGEAFSNRRLVFISTLSAVYVWTSLQSGQKRISIVAWFCYRLTMILSYAVLDNNSIAAFSTHRGISAIRLVCVLFFSFLSFFLLLQILSSYEPPTYVNLLFVSLYIYR